MHNNLFSKTFHCIAYAGKKGSDKKYINKKNNNTNLSLFIYLFSREAKRPGKKKKA